MQPILSPLLSLLLKALGQVWTTLQHNWPFLVASIFMAAAMKLYLNKDAVAGFLRRYEKGGVLAATAAAVGTPLCSCGTTAIVLGMMAGSLPWAPIIAFMVASPLTSPEELIYSAGLFGWPFAIAFFGASIVLGLAGGAVGAMLEARGWLRGQARFVPTETACGCETTAKDRRNSAGMAPAPVALASFPVEACRCAAPRDSRPVFATAGAGSSAIGCGCDLVLPLFVAAPEPRATQAFRSGQTGPAVNAGCCAPTAAAAMPSIPREAGCGCSASTLVRDEPARVRLLGFDWMPLLREVATTGRRLLVMFLAFATIGYLINDLIPAAWITSLFGSGHAYGIPLAATLGLPFYMNSEASLPLVLGMLNSGMSSGAALAFLITGAGTSIGAVAGAMTIARWRVIGLVIGTLWVGAIVCGFAYDALASTGLF